MKESSPNYRKTSWNILKFDTKHALANLRIIEFLRRVFLPKTWPQTSSYQIVSDKTYHRIETRPRASLGIDAKTWNLRKFEFFTKMTHLHVCLHWMHACFMYWVCLNDALQLKTACHINITVQKTSITRNWIFYCWVSHFHSTSE